MKNFHMALTARQPVDCFFFPDSSGTIEALGGLSDCLPDHVQAFGIVRRTGPDNSWSLRDLADYSRECLSKVHQENAICMIGWSFGASLAFETTRLLEECNYSVKMLVMIDPEPPTKPLREDYFSAIKLFGWEMDKQNVNHDDIYATVITNGINETRRLLPPSIANAVSINQNKNIDIFSRSLYNIIKHLKLLVNYQPEKVVHPECVIYIKAKHTNHNFNEWQTWFKSKKLFFKELDGDHRSLIINPNVQIISNMIEEAI